MEEVSMHRKLIMIAAVSLLVGGAVAHAAPFGFIDGLSEGENAATGVVGVTGWALDMVGVERVDIFVDDTPVGLASYGQHRPIVGDLFPGFPDSDNAGFGIFIDTTRFLNGLHTIRAKVTSLDGTTTFLPPITVEFYNTTHLLHPFGDILFPQANAELRGNCDLNDSNRRLTPVMGWALDAGVEVGDAGMGYVELLVDGSIVGNSKTTCRFISGGVGLADCYGLRRLDVERAYPTLPDSPHAGFRFILDIGKLMANGYAPGHHVLTIRAGDISGQVANIDEIPVTFACDESIGNEESIGKIDRNPEGGFYGGVEEVTGWALDWEGVAEVRIFANGELVGTATYGIARPGIASRYPSYPGATMAGWSFALDTTALPDGITHLQAVVEDDAGDTTLVAEKQIRVNNEHPL